jgi:predicted membrane protein
MFDFNSLSEFSQTHCIALCAFLVPTILLLTLTTIILTAFDHAKIKVIITASLAFLSAVVMITHVVLWFLVGVIMPPTFILLYMATGCFIVNTWALIHPVSMTKLVMSEQL